MFGDRQVLRREGVGLLLDAGRQDRHGLGAGLHVLLHHLDQARGLASHQLTVRLDLPEHAFGEHTVAFVEVLEGGRDVVLDLLELAADALHPVQGGGVGDLADRRTEASIEARVARPLSVRSVNESSSRAERSASAWNRSSLEFKRPLMVWSRESSDTMRSCSGRASAPRNARSRRRSRASGRSPALDGQEAVGQAFVHGAFDRRGDGISPGVMRGRVFVLLESTQQAPGCPGVLRGSGGAVLIHDVARDLGPPRGASRGA